MGAGDEKCYFICARGRDSSQKATLVCVCVFLFCFFCVCFRRLRLLFQCSSSPSNRRPGGIAQLVERSLSIESTAFSKPKMAEMWKVSGSIPDASKFFLFKIYTIFLYIYIYQWLLTNSLSSSSLLLLSNLFW